MARLRVSVEFSEGRTAEFPVTPKCEVDFERTFGVGLGKAFQEQRREHIYHLAWLAHKVTGEGVKPFNEWLDGIAEVELLADVDRPTTATA